MPQRLEKFGTVGALSKNNNTWEFYISSGFKNTMVNTLEFMKVAKEIAGEDCNKVKKFITDENTCHLILTNGK